MSGSALSQHLEQPATLASRAHMFCLDLVAPHLIACLCGVLTHLQRPRVLCGAPYSTWVCAAVSATGDAYESTRCTKASSRLPFPCCCVAAPHQVELLLTMEEFCAEEGAFEPPQQQKKQKQGADSSGVAFAPLFANLLQLLYDGDLLEEAAINAWAEEKQHADEDEKVFLNKVRTWGTACLVSHECDA